MFRRCSNCGEPTMYEQMSKENPGVCRGCYEIESMHRFKEIYKAPEAKEDTECNWTEWNPESGQYEPLRHTSPSVGPEWPRPSFEDVGTAVARFREDLRAVGRSKQEPSPPQSDQSADTEGK